MMEFDCFEITLCGRQDVKIQLLTGIDKSDRMVDDTSMS